jgi:hypothetical protein
VVTTKHIIFIVEQEGYTGKKKYKIIEQEGRAIQVFHHQMEMLEQHMDSNIIIKKEQ